MVKRNPQSHIAEAVGAYTNATAFSVGGIGGLYILLEFPINCLEINRIGENVFL